MFCARDCALLLYFVICDLYLRFVLVIVLCDLYFVNYYLCLRFVLVIVLCVLCSWLCFVFWVRDFACTCVLRFVHCDLSFVFYARSCVLYSWLCLYLLFVLVRFVFYPLVIVFCEMCFVFTLCVLCSCLRFAFCARDCDCDLHLWIVFCVYVLCFVIVIARDCVLRFVLVTVLLCFDESITIQKENLTISTFELKPVFTESKYRILTWNWNWDFRFLNSQKTKCPIKKQYFQSTIRDVRHTKTLFWDSYKISTCI